MPFARGSCILYKRASFAEIEAVGIPDWSPVRPAFINSECTVFFMIPPDEIIPVLPCASPLSSSHVIGQPVPCSPV